MTKTEVKRIAEVADNLEYNREFAIKAGMLVSDSVLDKYLLEAVQRLRAITLPRTESDDSPEGKSNE